MTTIDEREAAREVSGLWWVFLVTGILWFIISLVVLRFDETSIDTVGVIIGVVFAVGCVERVHDDGDPAELALGPRAARHPVRASPRSGRSCSRRKPSGRSRRCSASC